jgi:hypothetical protein
VANDQLVAARRALLAAEASADLQAGYAALAEVQP